jgi:mannose-6-phosphate isomerase-like protein (cupin superfamily)
MLAKLLYLSAALTLTCIPAGASEIRRVVTTLDNENRSTTLFDAQVPLEAGKSGIPGADLWVTDSDPASFSQADAAKTQVGLAPPVRGTVFRVIEFLPVDDAKLAKMDPSFMMKVVGSDAPARGVPPSSPLMHRTRTVDYAIIMSGEIDMKLDDETIHLKQGDIVVQQATNHAWLNHGKEPCRVLFVLMDSKQP